MSDNLSVAQFGDGSAPSCPECGTAGQPEPGVRGRLQHVETPGHCRTYTWTSGGAFIARDVHSKSERLARADATDARLRKLNPFRRDR